MDRCPFKTGEDPPWKTNAPVLQALFMTLNLCSTRKSRTPLWPFSSSSPCASTYKDGHIRAY